ncbi:hypothetical protein B0H13DRAFT_2354909 [Mycena leptocephala]|nr:hypothetical protein B0H13DRAFT_2354909 [Mycena leptocephala]
MALPSPTCSCCLPTHFRSRSPYSAAHWTVALENGYAYSSGHRIHERRDNALRRPLGEVAGKEWVKLRLDGVALLERTALGHTRKIDRYPSDMRGPQRTTHQSEKGAALLPVIFLGRSDDSSDSASSPALVSLF